MTPAFALGGCVLGYLYYSTTYYHILVLVNLVNVGPVLPAKTQSLSDIFWVLLSWAAGSLVGHSTVCWAIFSHFDMAAVSIDKFLEIHVREPVG